MKDNHLHIAFAFDRWAFRSACVAIQTSAKSLAADSLITFHFFIKGLEEKHLRRLDFICRSLPVIANYQIYPVDDKEFLNCRSLYGNFMTYVRLLIPDLVGSDRIIYLDSDTLTNGDLTRLWKTNLGDYTIGSVSLATIQWSNDKTFLLHQGLSLEDPYFNAGILLIDCEKWRNKEIGHRLLDWARLYGPSLPSVDQTLLNLFFHKGFHRLDPEWNQHIYPLSRPPETTKGVLHFLGTPKPWDIWAFGLPMSTCLYRGEMARQQCDHPRADVVEWVVAPFRALRAGRSLIRMLSARFNNVASTP